MPGPATDAVVALAEAERAEIARRRATCPFLGPVVAEGRLAVRNDPARPLASLADLAALGNTGGGDLGDVLRFFGEGNHAFMAGQGDHLDLPVPAGLFSLDLPGSQGSHPGHSGILQADPGRVASGRFDEAAFARLIAPTRDGLLTRADVGRFIAANLRRDPAARALAPRVALRLALDFGAFAGQAGPAAIEHLAGDADTTEGRKLYVRLTRLMGRDHLVGSAGEWGLLFAFFENRPDARRLDGEPTLPVAGLMPMFRDLRLPVGWETWKKRRAAWIANTTGLAVAAGKAYLFGR